MGGLLLRLKSWWDGADKNQRTITIVGGGFLIFLVVVTYLFTSKPRMGLLATGLTPAQMGAVDQELSKEGIP
jgi:flagellar biosynthesis/type III secretory pathway M-ring protein FliF/YscJ